MNHKKKRYKIHKSCKFPAWAILAKNNNKSIKHYSPPIFLTLSQSWLLYQDESIPRILQQTQTENSLAHGRVFIITVYAPVAKSVPITAVDYVLLFQYLRERRHDAESVLLVKNRHWSPFKTA